MFVKLVVWPVQPSLTAQTGLFLPILLRSIAPSPLSIVTSSHLYLFLPDSLLISIFVTFAGKQKKRTAELFLSRCVAVLLSLALSNLIHFYVHFCYSA
jgi:hypothetical protein